MSKIPNKRKLTSKDFGELVDTMDAVLKQANKLSVNLATDLLQYSDLAVQLEVEVNKEISRLFNLVDFDGYSRFKGIKEEFMAERLESLKYDLEQKAKDNILFRVMRHLGFHGDPTLHGIMNDKDIMNKSLPYIVRLAKDDSKYFQPTLELEKHIDDLCNCKVKLLKNKTKGLSRHLMDHIIPKFTYGSETDAFGNNFEVLSKDPRASFYTITGFSEMDFSEELHTVSEISWSRAILFETQQLNGPVIEELGDIIENLIECSKGVGRARRAVTVSGKKTKSRRSSWVEVTATSFNESKAALAKLNSAIQAWNDFKTLNNIELK